MDSKKSALQALPPSSRRKQIADQRAAGDSLSFAQDERAESDMDKIQNTMIGFLVLLFISFLLFDILGPDSNEICNDVESSPGAGDGNFTQDECDGARDARGMFFTGLVIAGVASLLIILGVALAAFKKKR